MYLRIVFIATLFAAIYYPFGAQGTVTSTLEDQVADMSKALNNFVNKNLGVDQLQVY